MLRNINFAFLSLMILSGCAQHTSPAPGNSFEDFSNTYDAITSGNDIPSYKRYRNDTPHPPRQHNVPGIQEVPVFDRMPRSPLSIAGNKHPRQEVYFDKENVKLSVENIPLNTFVDLVLGSVLKRNYTVSSDVRKMTVPITLNMQTPQNTKAFFKVFKQLLSLHHVSIRPKNGTLFVYKNKSKQAPSDLENLYIGYGRTLPKEVKDDQRVMMFVPYYYIKAVNTVKIIRSAGIQGLKFYYNINGMQTIVGKASEVRKALKIIQMLDRPAIEGKIPYLVSLENISVDDFAKRIKEIFELNGIKVVNNPSQRGIVLLPIGELNMLYVISPKKSWINTLMYWKKKLDVIYDGDDIEPRLYVYHVKNRKAEELALAIKNLLASSRNNTSVKTNTSKRKHPDNTKTGMDDYSELLLRDFDYTPNIIADKDTNLLMLKLLPSHYKALLPFIRELDKLPLQTLVEVTVAEVSMTDTFSLGFEYALRNYSIGIPQETLDISGGGSGLGIVFRGNRIDATINALAQKELLNIVSKPKMLIMNNNTGTINVGTQVPIVTSEVSAQDTAATTPSINRNITYRTTGINLGVVPTINSNGILTMKINISLSEAQLNDTSGIDSPLIVNRDLSTVAVIRSGDTILIGGLISNNKSASRGGVPGLKDIPVVGNLFANKSTKNTKTELIMLIRPTIIHSSRQISSFSDRYQKLMRAMSQIAL